MRLFAVAACAGSPGAASAQEPVVSVDSTLAVTLPYSFQPAPLNAEADLQFADSATSSFFLILADEKDDLVGWNLTRHSMITLANMLVNAASPEVVGPEHLEINGHAAVQYEVHGVVQGTRVSYLHTTIDAPNLFAQVLAWTVRSDWEANEQLLRDLTATVRVMQPQAGRRTTIFDVVPGTWTWLSNPKGCASRTQTFAIAADRRSMTIRHAEPFEGPDGTMKQVTNYVIESYTDRVLSTYIPDETRLTDAGVPVEWDLVLIGRNRIAWHRTDWPEGAYTGMLRKCEGGPGATQPASRVSSRDARP